MAQAPSSRPTLEPRWPWRIGDPGNDRPDLQHELAVLQQQVNSVLTQQKQKRLDGQIDRLVAKIHRIRGDSSDSERRSTVPFAVPGFVATIESANLYFDFKEAAKTKHARNIGNPPMFPRQIVSLLRDDEMLQSKFQTIGELELRQAAAAIFFELADERRLLRQPDGIQKREDPALRHPIYNLVFRARHQAIAMDEDPVLELQKIMKSDPCFYDGNLRPKEPPVEHATDEARKSYAEFWSKYVKSASDAKPCVENDEDAGSVLPHFEMLPSYVSKTAFSEEFVSKKKLETFEAKMSELLRKKEELEVKLTDLLAQTTEIRNTFFEWRRRSGLQSAIIHFVAAVEKANLYFDFKKAAMDKYRSELLKTPKLPCKIFDTLRTDETLMSKFARVSEVGFRQAAMAIFVELGDERRHEREVKHAEDFQKCGFKKREDRALANPINRLVHRTREQEIVMDRNPMVELERIMKSDPCFYNRCLNVNVGEKPVDGLAVEAAYIKYSEFWSKYANRAEPAMETAKDNISSMLDNMGISVNRPTTNAGWVDETKVQHP